MFEVGLEELGEDGDGAVDGELLEGVQGPVVEVGVTELAWKENSMLVQKPKLQEMFL